MTSVYLLIFRLGGNRRVDRFIVRAGNVDDACRRLRNHLWNHGCEALFHLVRAELLTETESLTEERNYACC